MHYPADFRKTLPGPRVAAGKLQHRFQIALLPHQPHAHRIHQSEHKRDMSQHQVRRSLHHVTEQILTLQHRFIHFIRNFRIQKNLVRHIVNRASRRLYIHTQNIQLVRVAQNGGKAKLPLCQVIRQLKHIVQPYGLFRQQIVIRFCRIVFHLYKIFNQTFPEQNIRTEFCMIHGKRVTECMIPAHLLKPSDVVQHPQQPGQVLIVPGHPQTVGNHITQPCHTKCVLHF